MEGINRVWLSIFVSLLVSMAWHGRQGWAATEIDRVWLSIVETYQITIARRASLHAIRLCPFVYTSHWTFATC